jgi:hypothetical protein
VRYTGDNDDREGEIREIVHADSEVGESIVVILSYRIANNKGGRFK